MNAAAIRQKYYRLKPIIEKVIVVLFPFVLGLVVTGVAMLYSHETSIEVLKNEQKQAYTVKDAKADQKEIADALGQAIRDMRSEQREEYRDLKQELAQLRQQLRK